MPVSSGTFPSLGDDPATHHRDCARACHAFSRTLPSRERTRAEVFARLSGVAACRSYGQARSDLIWTSSMDLLAVWGKDRRTMAFAQPGKRTSWFVGQTSSPEHILASLSQHPFIQTCLTAFPPWAGDFSTIHFYSTSFSVLNTGLQQTLPPTSCFTSHCHLNHLYLPPYGLQRRV